MKNHLHLTGIRLLTSKRLICLIVAIVVIVAVVTAYQEWATNTIIHLPDRPLKRQEVGVICKSLFRQVAKHRHVDPKTFRLVYVRHYKVGYMKHDIWEFYFFSRLYPDDVYKMYWMEENRTCDDDTIGRQKFLDYYGSELKAADRAYIR